ncbi:MAG: DUF4922 domain-containing protein, partial [Muribaculaceae bacterium]|nr:DUF4922 domain-containing protein [Muribaculaceae bacterium]
MDIDGFIARQLAAWPEAAERHAALDRLEIKTVTAFGTPLRVQFNPARAVSTAAKVDAAAIASRPCFLCEKNRPACQSGIDLGGYTLLVNPFPIHPGHLV